MKFISMLNILQIDYIDIQNLLKFKDCNRYSFASKYLSELKIDDRIEKLYLEQKESD